jgi:ABC-type sugar transport system, ATPase component
VFEQLGVRLDPDRLARGLSIADQQLVEIAKALTTNARVIVMDEPTAALTNTEVDRLFRIVETLREHGSAVLFVSHRLEEIFAICQRVTVMRDGSHVLTKPVGELTRQSVIRAMVGRDMDALFPKIHTDPGLVVLKVDRLTREGVFTDISSTCAAERSWRLPGSSVQDERRSPARSSESIAGTPVRSRSPASRCGPARRRLRWRRDRARSPRTVASRGS